MIALRTYLDSSGKLENDWITLAAIAATDEIWLQLEAAWAEIMEGHTPKGKYIHMREVYRLIKAFDKSDGRDHDKAFGLVNKCLVYMSHLDKKRFRMFYCSVDLRAWRKLRAETYQMPDPIDICNEFCSESILGWYLLHYPDLLNPEKDTVQYFFDRNEYFYQPFYDKWISEINIAEKTGSWSLWKVIAEVAPAIMEKTAGVQAADIVAWAINREKFAEEGDLAKHLGHILRSVIPAFQVIWDEDKLRKQYRPLLYLP